VAELAEDESGEKRGRWRGNGGRLPLGGRRGVQVNVLGLTSGVVINVWPPRGVHTLIDRGLTKLNRLIQSLSTVTETQSSLTFYSRFT
jgi:hypothetical protein